MKIAIFVLSKSPISDLNIYITAECTEIVTNNRSVIEYAKQNGIQIIESDVQNKRETVEYVDYVIVFGDRKSKGISSISSACKKYAKNIEVVFLW